MIFDTNIIIDHIRQRGSQKSSLENFATANSDEQFALSTISVQELYQGRSTRDELREQILLSNIAPLIILPYTYEVAELAGKLSRDHARALEFPDAAIAATALVNGAGLYTLNRKDFADIEGLVLYEFDGK